MGWRRKRAPIPPRSRWLPGYWLRHPLFSLVALLLGTPVLLLLEIDSAYRSHRLNTYGVHAEATVLEVHSLGRNSYVVASFTTADGHHVVTQITDYYWSPRPRVGDAATVLYDPASPDAIVRDIRIGDESLTAWVFFGLVVTLVSGGGVSLWRTWSMWRENAEDWRSGRHFA
ncbi:DUF3592 domain-containing protein [Micromonospora peucetia]|uniref:DUF3592 domain-containing protein n=1 Tax=Micromonospora peucetia TaxID=47871 RepID=UPI00225355A7|nr:DUF3592 domain-containing protein [Micromonospora peucetia]MCX4385602.1 DUF3592 domain-containing protein [Micromonospora peucetia]